MLKKVALLGLLGAGFAAIGALAGEGLFVGTAEPASASRSICLLFDVSGSMGETINEAERGRRVTQLEALQDAASEFVDRQDLDADAMGLATFSSHARVVAQPGHDVPALAQSISGLRAAGGTDIGRGLDVAREALRDRSSERWVLLFSDGKPESSSTEESPEQAALSAARRVRNAGIQIVAIGTGRADANLLEKITGDPARVIISDRHALAEAFRKTEQVINRQMLASIPDAAGFGGSLARTGSWACLIAMGAALGLCVGQNRHMRRRILGIREATLIVGGGLITGLLAGVTGQSLFFVLSGMPAVTSAARLTAWMVLGCGLGFGMGFFVPNLCRQRAAAAGAAGGLIAAVFFLTLVPAVGDPAGRILGAAILGFCTGLATVLVEAAYRKAWLIVHWGKNETSTLALGATPILVGSSREAHILIPGAVPIVARIALVNGLVQVEDVQTGRTNALHHGDVVNFGPVRVEVCAGAAERVAAAAPVTVPARARAG